jgi:hypothetical protein
MPCVFANAAFFCFLENYGLNQNGGGPIERQVVLFVTNRLQTTCKVDLNLKSTTMHLIPRETMPIQDVERQMAREYPS